jgi:uncharacterized Fe-S center protein
MVDKLDTLVRAAGILDLDYKGKFTAIKIHFGEPGNTAYLRPNYPARIAKIIREAGGKPFLTDASTLYVGRRANALDHLEAAEENGYSSVNVGCPIVIADGLKGTEERVIAINQKHCKTALIASAIADADILVSINHFKGHELTGFGGALKNLGMGSGSKAGKEVMHAASLPIFRTAKCTGCGLCVKNCAQSAISLENKKAVFNPKKCVGCGQCIAMCRFEAIEADALGGTVVRSCERIAEYSLAAINGKPNFHVNLIMDVSPNCDCWGHSDLPIVPNIGFAASKDPVALDRACADLVNKALAMPGCELFDKRPYAEGMDKFSHIYPNTNWKATLEHAEKIGLGVQDYILESV